MEHYFEANLPIKAVGDGPWIVEGHVSPGDGFDYDNEFMLPGGVYKGMDTFHALGSSVDYEHQYRRTLDPQYIIGVGRESRLEKGLPFLRTELYDDDEKPLARKVWKHVNTRLSDGTPGYAGYSLEGKVLERDASDKRIIKGVEIHRITISLSPKGMGQTRVVPVGQVVKAMYGDEDALEEMAVPDGSMEYLKSVLESHGAKGFGYGEAVRLLKAYTTGSAIVMPGPGVDAAAMRSQVLISPQAASKKKPAPAPKPSAPVSARNASVRKAAAPKPTAAEVKADRLEFWRRHCRRSGLPERYAPSLMRHMEAL